MALTILTREALEQMDTDDVLGLAMAIAPLRVVDDAPSSKAEYVQIVLDEQRPEMPDYTQPAILSQRLRDRFPL